MGLMRDKPPHRCPLEGSILSFRSAKHAFCVCERIHFPVFFTLQSATIKMVIIFQIHQSLLDAKGAFLIIYLI